MAHNHLEPVVPAGDGGLVRLRLDLSYDGCDFAGWAIQPGQRTVQGVLEAALGTIFRTEAVRTVVAGRTDAGVHAVGQVAHCELAADRWAAERSRIVRRLAGVLPADLRVYAVSEVSTDFDARFSALWRSYRYRICDSDTGPDPLRRHDTVHWRRSLDASAMQQAGQGLLGLHDFAAFCRRRDGATTVRQLQQLSVHREQDLIVVQARADAFCHSMVRSLVGALAAVGDGRRAVDWPAQLLQLGHRSDEVTVAPPHGLALVEVGYPPPDQLAARAAGTRTLRTLEIGRSAPVSR
ncbi:MAG: tRNA pseudouridine(38-40) synthase TruA [Jatrophihabitantaceae bacterium]